MLIVTNATVTKLSAFAAATMLAMPCAGQGAWQSFFNRLSVHSQCQSAFLKSNFWICARLSPGSHKTLIMTNACVV